MEHSQKYEIVIGLEVHAQLLTATKLFAGDDIAYGAAPNTQVSAITLAHPGTLPRTNRSAVRLAVTLGLACECEIERVNYFARKNYFYPDLPKGYQISQHTTPICKGGKIFIRTEKGERFIKLNRIHMEEDAGKSIHDISEEYSSIDFNRAGTPLLEIVTEPDLHSAAEVSAYLTELRRMLRYLNVCDGNMEEGSMRCDVNISARPTGARELGTKVEIKNLNSIRNARRAVEAESARLTELLDRGEMIIQQTRGFDANTGLTYPIRDKEDADDYRYFPDPDLAPFHITDEFVQQTRASLPMLQPARISRYVSEFSLSEYDAQVLTDEKETAEFFEDIIANTKNYKAAANWMTGPVRSWMNEHNSVLSEFPLKPATISKLIEMVDRGEISFSSASSRLFTHLLAHPSDAPAAAAAQLNLLQQSDTASLAPVIDEVLAKYPDKVIEFRKGKKGLLSLFVGEVMKKSKGKADPRVTNELLLEKLKG